MEDLPKLGSDANPFVELRYPDIWEREDGEERSRLIIGAHDREIALILELSKLLEEPFGVLFVLVTSSDDTPVGRYQSPEPIGYDDLEAFLTTFQDFLEHDGRMHLWVTSLVDLSQFVYDNHNIIYAYGDVDRYEEVLREFGFSPGAVDVMSRGHAHHYHAAFDDAQREIMAYWEWIHFPLQETDDPE